MAMTGSAPSSCDTCDLLLLVFSLNALNRRRPSVPTVPMGRQPTCPYPRKGIEPAHSRCSLTVWPEEMLRGQAGRFRRPAHRRRITEPALLPGRGF